MSYDTTISEKITDKIGQIVKDPKEKRFLQEILERELTYGSKEMPPKMKKEFKLILEHHFPFERKSHG